VGNIEICHPDPSEADPEADPNLDHCFIAANAALRYNASYRESSK
jgi:hypothetical protein